MLRNPACLDPTPENLFFPPHKGDYVYFESPPPGPGSPVEVEAAWAADAAMLAYARYGSTRMTEDEFTGILRGAGLADVHLLGDCFVDNASTARGFFAANDSYALLAFRGTEKDNAHDVAADADIPLVDSRAGRVHRGFRRYLDSVSADVVRFVGAYRTGHPTQPLCITGHSLGAALAALAFADLKDPASSLYTFGCPRVGDQEILRRDRSARCVACLLPGCRQRRCRDSYPGPHCQVSGTTIRESHSFGLMPTGTW